jgi:dephospho-CoA kinase
MTKIIGVTGGIGSGKSTIATYIQSLGYPVYIADWEAKKLMETPEMAARIEATFGADYVNNQHVNREKLAQHVFQNPEALQQLNAIVHPAVQKHFEQWVHQQSNAPFVFKEAAILFESGSYANCDSIITVVAPLETRIERVIARDNTTREAVLQRIQNQWTDEERIAKSDFTIQNTNLEAAQQQTETILNLLKNQ